MGRVLQKTKETVRAWLSARCEFDAPVTAALMGDKSGFVFGLDCIRYAANVAKVTAKVNILPMPLRVKPVNDHMRDCLFSGFMDLVAIEGLDVDMHWSSPVRFKCLTSAICLTLYRLARDKMHGDCN